MLFVVCCVLFGCVVVGWFVDVCCFCMMVVRVVRCALFVVRSSLFIVGCLVIGARWLLLVYCCLLVVLFVV